MTSIFQIENVITLITLICAYFISVITTGTVQALIARHYGDDTPERNGFLTLNPAYYIDLVGFISLLAFRFGWGKVVPLNPHNIHGRFRTAKIMFTFLSEALTHVFIGTAAFFVNLLLIGPHGTQFTYMIMFVERNVSLRALGGLFPGKSSLILAFVMVLASIIFLNIFMAVLSLIINGFRFILFMGAERGYNYMQYAEIISFVGPLIILLLFRGYITLAVIHFITWAAYSIAALCGISS